jgi:hypothetical protein
MAGRRESGRKPGTTLAPCAINCLLLGGEAAMSHVVALRRVVGFLEHALAVIFGALLMVLGLGLGVTMIMLPVGLVIGLIGFAMVVSGLFVHIDEGRSQR